MNSEFFLAKRYINTQKRHSAFTIGSIMLAIALMTMLFTAYSTLRGCERAVAYDKAPYHMRVNDFTKEQAELLCSMSCVKEYKISESFSGACSAEIMFKTNSIKASFITFCHETAEYLGMEPTEFDTLVDKGKIRFNSELMGYDLVDSDSRGQQMVSFCIFFVYIIIVALSLRFMIDTAFEISSKERERQFGVLQSIGAEPKQVVKIITNEGMILSAAGIPLGIALGIGIAFIAYKAILSSGVIDAFFTADKAEKLIHFHVDPLYLLIAAVTGFVWVMLSAYGTGMRIMRKTPIEAISARPNEVKRVRRHSLSGLLFGWTGKLADRNTRREKKRFIVTSLSITVSIILYSAGTTVIGRIQDTLDEVLDAINMPSYFIYPLYDDEIASSGQGTSKKSLTYDRRNPLEYRKILDPIEKSDMFEDISFSELYGGKSREGTDPEIKYLIEYVTEYTYKEMFGENPPISYAELEAAGGYVIAAADEAPENPGTVELTVTSRDLPAGDYSGLDQTMIDSKVKKEDVPAVFDITASAKLAESETNDFSAPMRSSNMIFLVAPLKVFDDGAYELYGNYFNSPTIMFELKDDSLHKEATEFLEKAVPYKDMYIYDNFDLKQKFRTVTSAINIGINFITAMLILTALVNMVNIISTGVINRRSELATMQCVGMTRGQLYYMTVIESLQYALFSGIAAAVICVLMVKATSGFVTVTGLEEGMSEGYVDSLTDVSIPLIKAGIATAVSFAAAFLSALIPLKTMQRDPLVEQIRKVD